MSNRPTFPDAPTAESLPFEHVLSLEVLAQHALKPHRSVLPGVVRDALIEQAGGEDELMRVARGETADEAVYRLLLDLVLVSGQSGAAVAITEPFGLLPIGTTPSFDALVPPPVREKSPLLDERALLAYSHVLEACTGTHTGINEMPILTYTSRDTGLTQHVQLHFETAFLSVEQTRDLDLDVGTLRMLERDSSDVGLWRHTLPDDAFRLRGVTVVRAVDVTVSQATSRLSRLLLKPQALTSDDSLKHITKTLRTLFGVPSLEVGFLSFVLDSEHGAASESDWFGRRAPGTRGAYVREAVPIGRSLLLDGDVSPVLGGVQDSAYAGLSLNSDASLRVDVDEIERPFEGETHSFDRQLARRGYRSLILAPLRMEGQMLGLMELASDQPQVLDRIDKTRLSEVVSVVALAVKRTLDAGEDRLQAVMKRQFTAIHPVVEWRFRRAARRMLDAVESGPQDWSRVRSQVDEPILFKNVYGLFGQSDIRGSSSHRNATIQQDLIEQLKLARAVSVAASQTSTMPAMDELTFRIDHQIRDVEDGLSADEENRVLFFLRDHFEPHLPAFAQANKEAARAADVYHNALDDTLQIVYKARKQFERNMTRMIDSVSGLLDEEQARMQPRLPHYFEKFKTDGVEYSMYVGESLMENETMPPMALRSLRLWQLTTAVEIQHRLDRIRPYMSLPLDMAHLILVQPTPVTIRFRSDERRFDVDGAYNNRYEIMKKRIDKANVVNDEGENLGRLTQPGKIAIVYAADNEVTEYADFVLFLRARGMIEGEVERLDLEDLQGVKGLKALRVTIAAEAKLEDKPNPKLVEIDG